MAKIVVANFVFSSGEMKEKMKQATKFNFPLPLNESLMLFSSSFEKY